MRYAARAVIVENGKLLVMERRRTDKTGKKLHYLSLPGGQIDDNEDPEVTVVRELREEMLIEIEVEKLVAHVYMTAKEWWQSQEHMIFMCKRVSGEPKFNSSSPEAMLKNGEEFTPQWRPLDELEKEPKLHRLYEPVMQALLPYIKASKLPESPIDIDVADLL